MQKVIRPTVLTILFLTIFSASAFAGDPNPPEDTSPQSAPQKRLRNKDCVTSVEEIVSGILAGLNGRGSECDDLLLKFLTPEVLFGDDFKKARNMLQNSSDILLKLESESKEAQRLYSEIKERQRDALENFDRNKEISLFILLSITFIAGLFAYAHHKKYESELKNIKEIKQEINADHKEILKLKDDLIDTKNRCEKSLKNIDEIHNLSKLKLNQIQENVFKSESLTKSDLKAVNDVAKDDNAPIVERLRAKAIKATSEKQWDKSLQLWGIIAELPPHDSGAFFGMGIASQRLSEEKGDDTSLLINAKQYYDKHLQQHPEDYRAYNNLGSVCFNLAKHKEGKDLKISINTAISLFKQSIEIKPDNALALSNWGGCLVEQAKQENNDERKQLLHEAIALFKRAETIQPGRGSYNLACVHALLEDFDECHIWLDKALELGKLPPCDHLREDKDLDSVRDQEWFKEILRKHGCLQPSPPTAS